MAGPNSDDHDDRPTSIAGSAAHAMAIQMVIFALGLLGSILVSRALGPEGRGMYYVPTMAVTVAFAVVHLSVELANTYLFSERIYPLRRLANAAAAAALVLGPAGILLILGAFALGRTTIFAGVSLDYVAIAAAALPFMLHATWMAHVFMLAKRLPRSQTALLVGAVVQAVGIVTLYAIGALDVIAVLLLYVTNYVVAWALHAWWSRRFAPPLPVFEKKLMSDVLGHGLRSHLGFVGYTVLLRGDVFLVNAYLGAADVGLYSVAVVFADFIWLVSQPLATAALPFQAERSIAHAAALTLQTARLCVLIALGLGLTMAATLWIGIPLVYGSEFADAYVVLLVLLPGVCAMALVRPLWNWLLRQGRPWRVTGLVVGAIAVNVALNAILLPAVGVVGASIACSVAYLLIGGGLSAWAVRIAGLSMRAVIPGPADVRLVSAIAARGIGVLRARLAG